jgi:dTDP-glucose 4,6-dehydratase
VIGSNSFSGSDFIDHVLESCDHQVIGISRSAEKSALFLPYRSKYHQRFTFYQLDLNRDAQRICDLLDQRKPEYVVNFAAQSEVAPSWDRPWDWFETNVVALSRLGRHLSQVKYLKRYLHISSPEVYGSCEGVVKEDAPLNPSTPYAVSKAAADLFLFTLVKNYQFPLVMVRATNVYGARQQLFKIIPRSVIAIKKGNKISLHGGGKAVKSYIHIRDVSRGELVVMEQGRPGEIYHLSPEKGVAVSDLVKMICRMMHVDFDQATENAAERPGQDRAYVIDSSKARQQFHWQPRIPLQEGLAQVITWIEDNWAQIAAQPQEYIHQV